MAKKKHIAMNFKEVISDVRPSIFGGLISAQNTSVNDLKCNRHLLKRILSDNVYTWY